MEFYERIEALRKSRKISQGKLEETLGFANGLIGKWKNSLPSADKIIKIADYFHVSIDYLLKGEQSNDFKLSDTQLELITSFETLDAQQQKVLLDLIRCFKMQTERK